MIVYGGVTSVNPIYQVWTGTREYNITPDVGSFKLDLTPSGGAIVSSYTTSDPSVCTVDEAGNVTVVGEGTCTITLFSEPTVVYWDDEVVVTITVARTVSRSGPATRPPQRPASPPAAH